MGGRGPILPDVVQPVPKIEAEQRTPTREDAAGREKRDAFQQTSQGHRPVGYGHTLTKKGQIQATQKVLDVLLSDKSFPCPMNKGGVSQRKSALSPHGSAVIVMMGAGDIVNYTDSLIKKSGG